MLKKIAIALIPVLALALLLVGTSRTSLAGPPDEDNVPVEREIKPDDDKLPIEREIETDDDAVLSKELMAMDFKEEEIKKILNLNEELRQMHSKSASMEKMENMKNMEKMEEMVNALDQELSEAQSKSAKSSRIKLKWIGRYCPQGAYATFRSSFGSVLSMFFTARSPRFHISFRWNWRSKTRTFTTSQNEFVYFHLARGNNVRNYSAGCR